MDQSERRAFLIRRLLDERPDTRGMEAPEDEPSQRRLLRALMNVRPPAPCPEDFLEVQDAYLQAETAAKGVTDASALPECASLPGTCLWQGDITALSCDAVVNAANSGMTGCYVPNHGCIDNAIHTYAGVQLRLECARLMEEQGHEEPPGRAKVTPGFNLPCGHVLHTVGPQVAGRPGPRDRATLASCYRSCLELAEESGLTSVAFCCISTGVFGYPNEEAAEVAVREVRRFLERGGAGRSVRRVVFNVFKDVDLGIYRRLLSGPEA